MRTVRSARRPPSPEAGFAMLFVFVLAAAVAFTLYLEIPRVAFEAQRQKEDTLIARGEQYQRAIQLYVRKNNRYPATIDELEKSTTVRFLRRRYKDPMTGKDEWKLIQVGANGVFLNSLTQKPPGPEQAKDKDKPATGSEAVAAGGQPQQPTQANLRRRMSEMGMAGPGQFQAAEYQPQAEPQLTQYPPPGVPVAGQPYAYQPGQQPYVAPGQQPYPQQQPGQPPYGYPQPPGQQPYNPQQPGQPPAPGQPVYYVAGQPVQLPPGVVPGQPGQQPYVYPPVQPGQAGYPQYPQVQPYPGQTGYPAPGQPYPAGRQPYAPGQQPYPYQPGQPYPTIRPGSPGPVYPAPPVNSQAGGYSPTPYPTQTYPQQYQQYPYSTQPGVGGAPGGPQPQYGQPGAQPSPFGQSNNPAMNMIMQQLTQPRPGGLGGAQQSAFGGQIMGGGIAGVASTAEAEGIKVYNEKSKYNEWEFIYDPKKDRLRMGQMGVVPGQPAQPPTKNPQKLP